MSRATIIIQGIADRQRAIALVQKVPYGTRADFRASKRSLPQNAKMWGCLTDIAQQLPWHGIKLRADDWKLLFLDALKRELRMVPNIDGTGFVNLGRSSSDLSREEMSDMIEIMQEFGARHGVKFNDPDEAAA